MPFPSQCIQNNWRSPLLPHSAACEWNSSCVTTATNQLAIAFGFFQFLIPVWVPSMIPILVLRVESSERQKGWKCETNSGHCLTVNRTMCTQKNVFVLFVRVCHSLLHHFLFFVRLAISWLYSLHKLMLNSVGRSHETQIHKTHLTKEPFLPFFNNTNISMYRPKIPRFKKPSIFCIVFANQEIPYRTIDTDKPTRQYDKSDPM